MGHEGFASALWRAQTPVRRLGVVLLIIVAGVVSFVSVSYSPMNASIAAWWPAAGLSVLALLASRGSRVTAAAVIAVITATGNALGGREVLVAALFGIANGIEAWIVARVVSGGSPEARLESLRDVSRLLIAALLGALSIGLLAGASAVVVRGDDFFVTFFGLVASHFSAIIIVMPLGLVTLRLGRLASVSETIVQAALLATLISFVFWPGNALPIAFVPFIALLWAAFRLSTLILAIELVVMALAVTVLTALGGGPFAFYTDDGSRTTIELIQLFFFVTAAAALLVSAARNEWANVVTQLEARQALLRSSIVSADTGIFIGERLDSGRLRIVGVNPVALDALGWNGLPGDWENQSLTARADQPLLGYVAIDELVRSGSSGRVELVRGARRFDVDIATFSQAGGRPIITITFTDVTARDLRERAALDRADELSELNRQKDDFIASVSHELRTPVTSILGFAEQLTDHPPDNSNTSQAGRIIFRNARRLADVIEDVLELSQLSSAEATIRPPVEIDLRRVLTECAEDATGLATPGRDVRIQVRVPKEPVIVLGVEQDLSRVCANLLSNAVKFSHDDGDVTAELLLDGADAVMRVTDHGLGIPAEFREMVWGRFARAPLDSHRAVPGTGLGLPIVKALVEQRLGGTVVLSGTDGGGITVDVRLPVVSPAVSSAQTNA